MSPSDFRALIRSGIDQTPIIGNLRSRRAVVLERIARGGGATNWYYCKDTSSLEAIEQKFLPGSSVSFYFDGRFRESTDPSVVTNHAKHVIAAHGECVVGLVMSDGSMSEVDFVTSLGELTEFLSDAVPSCLIFFGPFPARDNDGTDAVTFTVPDADGVIRAHPH